MAAKDYSRWQDWTIFSGRIEYSQHGIDLCIIRVTLLSFVVASDAVEKGFCFI